MNLFEEGILCLFALAFVTVLEEAVFCNNISLYFVASLKSVESKKEGQTASGDSIFGVATSTFFLNEKAI